MAHFTEIVGYEVLSTLGHGARSTIYAVRGEDRKTYALKHVIRGKPSDQRFLEQAICEHEVASRFLYPSIRRSYKLIRRRRFIRTTEICVVMEYVDGPSLEQYVIPDILDLCKLAKEVAGGLREMHDAGFVHADIKPNNILVTPDHHVKIIDFGQSCPIGTIKERIQGTPDYIAPEQVLRKRITPQTDMFNFGATLYWLLTRHHVPTLIPRGEAGVDPKPASMRCPVPRDINPAVPPALSSLVMSCVDNDRDQRPESMDIVIDRLDLAIAQMGRDASGEAIHPPGPPQHPPSPR
ncbi:MAG: serine/threonine-protein kinase [Planctomycetota bacterium]|nr:serine/threonine-protein kinase [Planctomycetota bacterium]